MTKNDDLSWSFIQKLKNFNARKYHLWSNVENVGRAEKYLEISFENRSF